MCELCVCVIVMCDEMDEDSADDGEFSNMALCVCSASENIIASEDELAHFQVTLTQNVTHSVTLRCGI